MDVTDVRVSTQNPWGSNRICEVDKGIADEVEGVDDDEGVGVVGVAGIAGIAGIAEGVDEVNCPPGIFLIPLTFSLGRED